jgi:chromosome partitioning protein
MDPQKSLTSWARERNDADLGVEAVTAGKLVAALRMLAKSKVSLAIIDTPATDCPEADAAMRAADLAIIPARPTVFDIWSSEATRAKLKAMRKDFAFVLTQCSPFVEGARAQDGAAALEAMGGLLRPLIANRVVYQEAMRHGLGVTEIEPEGKAAEEIDALWVSLRRRLGRVKPAERSRQVA